MAGLLRSALAGLGRGLYQAGAMGYQNQLETEKARVLADLEARIREQSAVAEDARARGRLDYEDKLQRDRATDPDLMKAAADTKRAGARAEVEGTIEGYGGISNFLATKGRRGAQIIGEDENGNPIYGPAGGKTAEQNLQFERVDVPVTQLTRDANGRLVEQPVTDDRGNPMTRQSIRAYDKRSGALVSIDGERVNDSIEIGDDKLKALTGEQSKPQGLLESAVAPQKKSEQAIEPKVNAKPTTDAKSPEPPSPAAKRYEFASEAKPELDSLAAQIKALAQSMQAERDEEARGAIQRRLTDLVRRKNEIELALQQGPRGPTRY